MTDKKFTVSGMSCAACQANVEKAVGRLDGVENVEVNLLTGRMKVRFDESRLSSDNICACVSSAGYSAEEENAAEKGSKERRNQQRSAEISDTGKMKKRLICSIILLVSLMYIAMGEMLGLPLPSFLKGAENALFSAFTQFLITIPVFILNRKFFISGFKSLIKKAPNMDSLVALGASASMIYGIFAIYRLISALKTGDSELLHRYAHSLYFESGATILTLVTVGKFLETLSKAKTSETLEKLASLAPKTANIIRNGVEITIPAENIAVGDTVVIRPGESIPVDGTVVSGGGYVDQSAITGESIPVRKAKGDTVISATVCKNGSFNFTASDVGDDTTLAKIIKLVDEAGSSKAPIARLADKISGIFVPTVIIIAIITLAAWLIAGKGFEFALNCAVSVLVISCPCALGLATPVAIMVGTGKAAENGILIKSAAALETLHSADTVVFDKTGTLTKGKPSVTDIIPLGVSRNELLALAAALESKSEHPLGKAITEKAAEEKLTIPDAEEFESVSGRGVKAKIGNEICLCGNASFMSENGVEPGCLAETEKLSSEGKTPIIFAKSGAVIGIIAVADTVRESSVSAIKKLQKSGVDTVLLTGDNALSAKAIGSELGIKTVISDVLPAEKEKQIRILQEQGKKLAMIGDGINDSPALTRADVGIAIGSGTDIAVESADIVLIKSSLTDAVTAFRLSRSVMKNIKMNLFWAFFYNALGIPLAAGAFYPAFGILLSPMIGSLAMSLSSLCVVLNALRLRKFKGESEEITDKGEMKMIKVLNVEGMMCEHCKARVIKVLEGVDGVKSAEVDLAAKTATVELSGDVADEILVAAVTDAGYEAEIK